MCTSLLAATMSTLTLPMLIDILYMILLVLSNVPQYSIINSICYDLSALRENF